MLVKELIEELKQYPEDTEVRMEYTWHDYLWDQWIDVCTEPDVRFEENYTFDNFAGSLETKDLVIIYD